MTAVLDDMDSRPGSTTSLLRTVIGLYLRDAGGWMSAVQVVRLMEALGVSAGLTRTALTRLRKKQVLDAEARAGVSGYAVGARASRMLERGDRRIHHPRSMGAEDRWCLVSFSVPESERERRHQLRRRLHWIGCGTVGPGLWVCPEYLRAEAEEILEDLGLRDRAVLFVTDRPLVAGPLRDAVSEWWDLDALAALHHGFIRSNTSADSGGGVPDGGTGEPGSLLVGPDGAPIPASAAVLAPTVVAAACPDTFAAYVRCIDSWRTIPYLDPGLPADCLPNDWPGRASSTLFLELRDAYTGPAAAFVRSVLDN